MHEQLLAATIRTDLLQYACHIQCAPVGERVRPARITARPAGSMRWSAFHCNLEGEACRHDTLEFYSPPFVAILVGALYHVHAGFERPPQVNQELVRTKSW